MADRDYKFPLAIIESNESDEFLKDPSNIKVVHTAVIDCPPAKVMEFFGCPGCWTQAFPPLMEINYTTPDFAIKGTRVGTERNVLVSHWLFNLCYLGRLRVWVRFIVVQSNRLRFIITHASRPHWLLMNRGLEDYLVEPLPDGKCKLTFTFCIEPCSLFRFVNRYCFGAVHKLFTWFFNDLPIGVARGVKDGSFEKILANFKKAPSAVSRRY